jgi:dephospho-CoA kinase
MLRVGLTGGIGTGKTTVGTMFVDLGCHLLDADQITHDLLRPGQAVHAAVVQAFGEDILSPDGTINRTVLGEIVFNDRQARVKLNGIVHPAVVQRQRDWLNEMEKKDPRGVSIVDAALMVEVGTYKNYDRVVVVTCTPEVQRQRLRERSGLSDEQIEARIRSQMPLEEKVEYADFVIENSGDLATARRQVAEVTSRLRELAASTSDTRRS